MNKACVKTFAKSEVCALNNSQNLSQTDVMAFPSECDTD